MYQQCQTDPNLFKVQVGQHGRVHQFRASGIVFGIQDSESQGSESVRVRNLRFPSGTNSESLCQMYQQCQTDQTLRKVQVGQHGRVHTTPADRPSFICCEEFEIQNSESASGIWYQNLRSESGNPSTRSVPIWYWRRLSYKPKFRHRDVHQPPVQVGQHGRVHHSGRQTVVHLVSV